MKNQRVLVTGGSKGIGEAIVRRLLEDGASVATAARSPLPQGLKPSLFVQQDIGTAEGAKAVADRVLGEWGGVDILVNCVGGGPTAGGGFQALTDEHWLKALSLNLLTAVRFDRAFVPGMMERKSGAIVHVSSIQHRLPLRDSLPYAAAKAALTTYSKGLANEAGPRGVRVNVVTPGFIETAGAHGMIQEVAKHQDIDESAARQEIVKMIGGIPLGAPGRPEDVAELVAYLVSSRGAFVHGANYVIDGGTMPEA